MSAEALLTSLDGVRKRGADQWSARCPAHDDRGPSLSVRATADGRVLLHCFAGCEVADVLAAIGHDMTALYPPNPEPGSGATAMKRRRLLSDGQALDMLQDEAQLIALCAGNLAYGVQLSEADRSRCMVAAGRVAYLRGEARS